MTDMTFAVCSVDNPHPRGWKLGDITGVYPLITMGCNSPKNVFIHVIEVPANVARIKHKILGAVFNIDGNPKTPIRYRSRWRILPSDLPASVRQALKTDKEYTVSWAVLKPYFKNHMLDRAITDGDIQ